MKIRAVRSVELERSVVAELFLGQTTDGCVNGGFLPRVSSVEHVEYVMRREKSVGGNAVIGDTDLVIRALPIRAERGKSGINVARRMQFNGDAAICIIGRRVAASYGDPI